MSCARLPWPPHRVRIAPFGQTNWPSHCAAALPSNQGRGGVWAAVSLPTNYENFKQEKTGFEQIFGWVGNDVYYLVQSRSRLSGLTEEVETELRFPELCWNNASSHARFCKLWMPLIHYPLRRAHPFYLSLSLECLRWWNCRISLLGNALSRHLCFSIHPWNRKCGLERRTPGC